MRHGLLEQTRVGQIPEILEGRMGVERRLEDGDPAQPTNWSTVVKVSEPSPLQDPSPIRLPGGLLFPKALRSTNRGSGRSDLS